MATYTKAYTKDKFVQTHLSLNMGRDLPAGEFSSNSLEMTMALFQQGIEKTKYKTFSFASEVGAFPTWSKPFSYCFYPCIPGAILIKQSWTVGGTK